MPKSNVENCMACGAPLEAPVQGGKVKCTFCGAVNVVRAHEKTAGDGITCPECGASNPKNAKHCGRCGIKLEFNCPKCGALNSYGTIYCVECGVDIPGEVKRQQEEMERLQNEERRRQAETRSRLENERKKKIRARRISFAVIALVVLVGAICVAAIAGITAYTTTYSPSARSTKTAYAAGQTATTVYRTLFQDDFSDPSSGWGDYSSENGSTAYENGGFRIQVTEPNWAIFYSLGQDFPEDIQIEVRATKIGGPDDNNFGILCRVQEDNQNYYYFAIHSDGYAGIAKVTAGNYEVISSDDGLWYPASTVHQGDVSNDIRADCIGDTFTLYVNGVRTATATDSSFTDGFVGLQASSGDAGGTDILFDNFNVYRP
ncbi:MAG: zinc ribbon domain-containing protein [Chloroflexota bacterium]